MFSKTTTELSMRRENASASPPRIIALTELSPKERATKVASAESGIVAPEFVSFAEAVKDLSVYESWTRLCLENLDALLSRTGVAVS